MTITGKGEGGEDAFGALLFMLFFFPLLQGAANKNIKQRK